MPKRDETTATGAVKRTVRIDRTVADARKIVWFTGGRSTVGTSRPEIPEDGEGPLRQVRLAPFGMDAYAVTNERFTRFVSDTGYRTEAEEYGWSFVFSGLLDDPARPAERSREIPWWVKVDGATWREPEGPGTDLRSRESHPVVHVSQRDAQAFARWAGARLPSEAEWEHAARAGGPEMRFPWGDCEPGDAIAQTDEALCNIWQGTFPTRNTCADGYYGTAPAGWGQPNSAGLYNMAGNVWEWTSDVWRIRSVSNAAKRRNALAAERGEQVLKGGSFLCHRSYCYRYRIAARSALPADSTCSNAGFRLAFDAPHGDERARP